MTNELLILIATHFACSDIAETRILTAGEIHHCSAVYTEIKLAFVPGVDPHHYPHLSLRERAAVSQAGFRAFYAWRQDNPGTVRHLRQVARGEAVLGETG